jgi:DNA-binding transcriptional regulator GbsR (MarR family)
MPKPSDEIIQFVEQFSLVAEGAGWTRIAGKVLAFLIVCEPAEQSPADLCQALMTSKASVSIVVRTLVERGFVERISRPGDRKTYLRVAKGVWGTLLVRQLGAVAAFQRLSTRAVDLLGRAEPNVRARAEEMAMFYRWWAAEAPGLIARWDVFRAEHLSV